MNGFGKCFAMAAFFLFSGCIAAAANDSPAQADKPLGSVKAQRAAPSNKAKIPTKKSRSAAKKSAKRETRQRAKSGARKQAGIKEREKPLRDADALLKNGKSADAYALLEPLEFDRAGEVHFDYLLAISALDSGKPDKATLAFERVLAVEPDFAGARLDMARAYFQLGDMPRAKAEFEIALNQNPPDAARTVIRNYLDAIAALEAIKQTRITGYVEGMLGHDSNVNASTSQTQISIPSFGDMTVALSPTNVKAADSYYGVAAGGEVSHNLNGNWGVYAGADLRQRGHAKQTSFDSLGAEGRAGVVFGSKNDRVRTGVSGGKYNVGRARNRGTVGFNAEWNRTLGKKDQLTVFGQKNRYRYVDEAMKTNDFDQNILGAGWLHLLADGKFVLFGSLYFGTEHDVAPVTPANPAGGRIDGAKRFSGLRVGGQCPVGEKTDLYASLGWQEGTYSKTNPLFMRKRSDRLYDLTLGANRRCDKLWTLRPQLIYSRNESNIAIYGFERTDLSVTMRRDFK